MVAATSWHQMVVRLLRLEKQFTELQFWGHGSPGHVYIAGKRLEYGKSITPSAFDKDFKELGQRLDGLLWWRTCATFAGKQGRAFCHGLAEYLDCDVAAHTFNIGFWHSGLHAYKVGDLMDWDENEGIKKGSYDRIESIQGSYWFDPNTIPCWEMDLPEWA